MRISSRSGYARAAATALLYMSGTLLPAQTPRVTGVRHFELYSPRDSSSTNEIVLAGLLSLVQRTREDPPLWISLPAPTYVGVFSITVGNRSDWFNWRAAESMVGATAGNEDSVTVALNPAPDHGAVMMIGRLRGDSIVGEWYVTSYVSDGGGRFRMRRVQE